LSKNNTTSSRQKEGCRIAVIGLFVNFILSAGKFMVGVSGNSIALIADSLNNFKLIQSVALSAAAKDNFADALITSMTLLSLIDLPFIAFPLDGLVGLIIA